MEIPQDSTRLDQYRSSTSRKLTMESPREGAHQMVSKVGAWICCFMLDTSLRQRQRQRQLKHKHIYLLKIRRRSHSKFLKKTSRFKDNDLSLYVEHVIFRSKEIELSLYISNFYLKTLVSNELPPFCGRCLSPDSTFSPSANACSSCEIFVQCIACQNHHQILPSV